MKPSTPKRVTAAPNTMKVGQGLRFTFKITKRAKGENATVRVRKP